MQSISFEQYLKEGRNQNKESFGVQLHLKVEGNVPLLPFFISREVGETTSWINKQRGRGQKVITLWLMLAHYLFFVIVQVLDR